MYLTRATNSSSLPCPSSAAPSCTVAKTKEVRSDILNVLDTFKRLYLSLARMSMQLVIQALILATYVSNYVTLPPTVFQFKPKLSKNLSIFWPNPVQISFSSKKWSQFFLAKIFIFATVPNCSSCLSLDPFLGCGWCTTTESCLARSSKHLTTEWRKFGE